jgi:drug/metabolite transporter (DMT)-like permease
MDNTSASTASIVFFIKPALAPILALILLGENMPANTIIGVLFILAGSLMTFTEKKSDIKEKVKIND